MTSKSSSLLTKISESQKGQESESSQYSGNPYPTEATVSEEYPPETAELLSWSALRFIRSPSVRFFYWSIVVISITAVAGLALLQFIHKDITVDSIGEVISDLGTRDAIAPSSGLVTEIRKKVGDEVEENTVIATITLDATTESEIKKTIVALKSLIQSLESAPKREEIHFVLPQLPTARLTGGSTIESLAVIELASKGFLDLKDRVSKGVTSEVRPLKERALVLAEKIKKMQKSKQKKLLELYLEASQEELGRVTSQIATAENEARLRLEQGFSELIRSLRVGLGSLETYLRQREVVAPIAGIVARVLVRANSNLESGKQVAIIMPKNGNYMAAIHLSSKDVVRVIPGQAVLLKMEAFPYQTYGLFEGKVISVDQAKEGNPQLAGMAESTGDFLVYASLNFPKRLPKESKEKIRYVMGMHFNAEIIVDRKPISAIFWERFFKSHD